MFKTMLNSYTIMLKKFLLASCTLLFLFEKSSTSTVKKPQFVRISEAFKPPFVKIFRRKQLSRPIPYYYNSTLARRIILSGDIKLNPGPENSRKYPKGKPQRKTNRAAACETYNETIRTNTKQLSCISCKNETSFMQ